MMAVFKEKAFAIHTIDAGVTVAGAEYGKVKNILDRIKGVRLVFCAKLTASAKL